jgi:hypothetical protein
MKRVDVLITQARAISRNSANADGTYSISDEEILQYLNDAQDRLQNKLCAQKNIAKIFVTQQIISVVSGQEAYTVPDRILLNKQIENVEFSYTGAVADYVRLEKLNFINRDTNSSTYPWGYIKRGGQILLQPTPSTTSGTIRVTYERELDDLDIPRGIISTVTGGTATQFTSVTVLGTPADTYETTTPGWSSMQYFCITDPLAGTRRCMNILINTYSTVTNVIAPNPSPYVFTANDSVPIAAAVGVNGDLCTFNKYTTCFSQLPDNCERYLIHYAANEVFKKDSSSDVSSQSDSLALIEQDIIEALKSQTSEVQYIPQADRYEWF